MVEEFDQLRVAEVRRYEVLDGMPRRELVAIAEIAAQVAGVPMASVNLIDDTHQYQVATAGFDPIVCDRDEAMCNLVLEEVEPVIVADARLDPRFHQNPFVTGRYGSVRFYAAHQLRTPAGVVVGMLCVLDTMPRDGLTAAQRRSLQLLAERVVDLLELELRSRDLQRRTDQLGRAVDQLHDAQAELERSNTRLAAFAGQVSHDLHNPLTAVSMSLRMLNDQAEGEAVDPESLRYVVHRASRATRRMQLLIDDLLAFARLDAQLQRVEVDLTRVVEDVTEDLEAELADVTLSVGALPTVIGDPVQLRAVMQNLLSNAAKFRRPDAPATIDVSGRRHTSSWGEAWRIVVQDNGLGIPPSARSNVFEPFVRSHTHIPGSGIGLATVKSVVEAHGGQIGVDETPGGGACVWFDLPVRAAEPRRSR